MRSTRVAISRRPSLRNVVSTNVTVAVGLALNTQRAPYSRYGKQTDAAAFGANLPFAVVTSLSLRRVASLPGASPTGGEPMPIRAQPAVQN